MDGEGIFVQARVLIVEDDALIAMALQDDMEDLGLSVVGVAARAEDAMSALKRLRPDVILLDLRLSHDVAAAGDGITVARAARAVAPGAKVVFITGSAEPAATERMKAAQPAAILHKPVSSDKLRLTLERVLGG